jgi:HIP---CoA ligase
MPTQPTTVPRLVRAAAERYGTADALVDGEQRLTFAELAAQVDRVAAAAIATGLRPGDRAAIWAPNTHEWVVAALGLLTAGAVLVPLNTRLTGREVGYMLAKTDAKLLVTTGTFLGRDYPAIVRDLPERPPCVVVLAEQAEPPFTAWPAFLAQGDGVDPGALRARADAIRPDDVSDIMFTSGTTGRPKGAMATHDQGLRLFTVWADSVGLRTGDRYLVVNPFFHTFGLKSGIFACLLRGATIIPQAVFDVPTTLGLVERERITVVPGPPALYESILAVPDRSRYDLSSLRLAVTGAAIVPVELVRRMRDELGFGTVITAYGLTEACGMVTICAADDDPETIANTSGRPVPGTEVRVVDRDSRTLPAGEPGEVLVRGYQVMRGYLDDPAATAEAVDADGWLHTGDVGILDAAGYLRITDRIKDMFIVGGFNAYPAEIEQVLTGHRAVAEAAVIGVPDARLGEVGKAFVVPRAGLRPDPDELIRFCREALANYKVPRQVEVVAALPRNASGKVLKTELRAGHGQDGRSGRAG